MRQAHIDLGAGPELATKVAYDPRADGGRRLILLGRRTVTIRRSLRGVKMHLSVPVETYIGVVMACEGQPDGVLYRVMLAHRDPDLSVTLKESRSRSAMVQAWSLWTAYFAASGLCEPRQDGKKSRDMTRPQRPRRTKWRTAGNRRICAGQRPRRGARGKVTSSGSRLPGPRS